MNTNNDDLLSICLLGYKHATFIKDNIEAIWNSDYKNIEIIVVDDGSPDNSGEILQELAAKSPCPMNVILQENTGNIGHNFNVAWKKAKGKYITFMSLDDVLNSNTIVKVMDLLNSDKKVAFVASSIIQGIDDCGRLCNNIPPLKLNSLSQPNINDLLELEYNEFGAFYIQGAFFRKEIVDAVNGFDEDMTGDDIILRTKVFKFMMQNPEWTFKILSEPLCFYRQHDSNVHLNSFRQIKIVSEYLERYWPNREYPEIFVAWTLGAIKKLTFSESLCFFSMNAKTASLLKNSKIQKNLIKKMQYEKNWLKYIFQKNKLKDKRVIKIFNFITITYKKKKKNKAVNSCSSYNNITNNT